MSIQKGINPILLRGWDWDHQTYSREGYGSLGYKNLNLHKPCDPLQHMPLNYNGCYQQNHLATLSILTPPKLDPTPAIQVQTLPLEDLVILGQKKWFITKALGHCPNV